MRMRTLSAPFEIPLVRFYSKHLLFACLLTFGAISVSVNAQQRLSKRYPAGKNVRIELKNIFGTITVESWNRDEIRLTAMLESPKANLLPQPTAAAIIAHARHDTRPSGQAGPPS